MFEDNYELNKMMVMNLPIIMEISEVNKFDRLTVLLSTMLSNVFRLDRTSTYNNNRTLFLMVNMIFG